uniref:Fmp27_GFWDK domain-containing protein n=1 Tax=Macrostomum lignano TaxID=282301 RepID=A0A1I8IF76_9PLAT
MYIVLSLIVFIVSCLILILCLPRLFVFYLASKLYNRLHIDLKVQYVGLFKGFNIWLHFPNNTTVEIKSVQITSSLWNKEAPWILTAIVQDVEAESSLHSVHNWSFLRDGSYSLPRQFPFDDVKPSCSESSAGYTGQRESNSKHLRTLLQFLGITVKNLHIKVGSFPRLSSLHFYFDRLELFIASIDSECCNCQLQGSDMSVKFITNKLLVSNQAGQSNEDMVRLLLMNSRIGAARLQLNQRTSDGSPVSVQCRVAEPRFFVTQEFFAYLKDYAKTQESLRLMRSLYTYGFNRAGLHEAEAADNSAIPVVAGGGARPPASASIDEEGSPLFWLPRRAELQIDALHCELEREMCRRSLVLEWSALSAKLQNDTAAEERDGGGGGRNSIASASVAAAAAAAADEFAGQASMRLALCDFAVVLNDDIPFAKVKKFEFFGDLYPKVIDFKLALLTPFFAYQVEEARFWAHYLRSVLPRSLRGADNSPSPSPTPSPAPAAAVTSSPRRRRQRLRARLGRLLGSKRIEMILDVRAEPGQSLCLEFGVTELQPGLRVTYGPTKLDLVLDTHGGYRPPVACQIQCASCDLQGPLCVQLSNQNPAHMRVLDSSLANALEIDSCHITCPKLSGQSDALQTKLTVSRCQLKVTRELVQTLTQLVHAWAASFAQQQSEQQQQQQPNRQPQPPLLAFRRPAILLHASLQEGILSAVSTCGDHIRVWLRQLDLELRSHQHQHHQQTGFGGATVSMDLKLLKVLHYSSWLAKTPRSVALSLHMLHAKTGPHGRLKLICSDPIEAFWSPGVHLCLKDIHEHCLAPILKLMHPAEISEAGRHDDASKPSSGPARALLIVNLQQQVSLTLQLSSSHGLNLCLSSLQLESGIARCETASLYFDSRRIFQAVALTVSASTHRQPRVGLNVPENKVYTTAMDTLLVRFPFEFDFYECMDHVLSTRKWLRSVHNHTDKDLIEDDSVPLGPDICVNIGSLTIELHDDPFELNLSENYLLMLDECLETEERILIAQAMARRAGHLDRDKLAQISEQLHARKADTFIKRKMKLRECPASQTLMTWSVSRLSVAWLLDTSLRGRGRLLQAMSSIDPWSPLPPGHEFGTLYGRRLLVDAAAWTCQLRDYPECLLRTKELSLQTRLVVAESAPSPNSIRFVTVEPGSPWPNATVIRCMPPLKFFHDARMRLQLAELCYGSNWQPAFDWFNQCFNNILRPTRDPSPPMPWWDKCRLKYHGTLVAEAKEMVWRYHTSGDPCNSTEFLELRWSNGVDFEWTNMLWSFQGDLDVHCRTASKYDDCRLFHFPATRYNILIEWITDGNPNDHHSVMPVNPDRLPKGTDLFRTRGINLTFDLRVGIGLPREASAGSPDPVAESNCYTNALKFFDKLATCLTKVSRPIRRGQIFRQNVGGRGGAGVGGRKPLFGRSLRSFRLNLACPRTLSEYWVSFSRRHGIQMSTGELQLRACFTMELAGYKDGLKRRPRAQWTASSLTVKIRGVTLSSSGVDGRLQLLELSAVDYNRSGSGQARGTSFSTFNSEDSREANDSRSRSSTGRLTAKHNVFVKDLKVRWTLEIRNHIFGLINIYQDAMELRKNLSAPMPTQLKVLLEGEAARAAGDPSVQQRQRQQQRQQQQQQQQQQEQHRRTSSLGLSSRSPASVGVINAYSESGGGGGGGSNLHFYPANSTAAPASASGSASASAAATSGSASGSAAAADAGYDFEALLSRLAYEREHELNINVSSDQTGQARDIGRCLHGHALCSIKDVLECQLRVDLLNLQLLLKSPNTPGYLIVCADRTCLSLAQCQPVWRGEELLSKSTVTGDLIGMQYFSTVGRGQAEERWLPEAIVRGNRVGLEDELKGCPDVVGAGPRVGGIVSDRVGSGDNLQRIVSRCRCDIRYASYTPGDPSEMAHLSIIGPAAEDPVFTNEEGVTTFTLWHHTIAACANSQQWERAIDLIQNLLFYVEPKRKELMERLQTLKWALFVKPPEHQRELILSDQEELRNLMQDQRDIEKDIYRLLKEAASPTRRGDELLRDLEARAAAVKEKIQDRSAVLALRINVYQVSQLGRHGRRNQSKQERMIRRNEICFEDATCVLTKEAGQLDFAKVILKDFLYTRTFKADYSGAHHIELGYLQVQDTANGCVDVVSPTHWRRPPALPDGAGGNAEASGGGADASSSSAATAAAAAAAAADAEADSQQQPFLRVDCVELPPITGISVKQSLEVQIDRLKLN